MKKTLKILPLLFGVVLFFTQCEKEAVDKGSVETYMELKSDEACSVTRTLWAGAGRNDTINAGTNVGSVTATVVGNTLVVEYAVEAPWYLTETHLWVGKNISDIPRQAAPGRFPFKANLDFESGWSQVVELEDLDIFPGDPIYVAAHGVVVFGEEFDGVYGLDGLENKIADETPVGFRITANSNTSYHNLFLSEAGYFDGEYDSYCIDPTKSIDAIITPYPASMYSSLSAPAGLVPYPNFNEVNWVINNRFVGETYNYADIQMAIWELLFGPPDPLGDAPYNWVNSPLITAVKNDAISDNVSEIVEAALENSHFEPGCDDYLVILLVPDNTNVQPHLIWKRIPCPDFGSETVWASGEYTFIDERIARKWGWIFEVDCTDE